MVHLHQLKEQVLMVEQDSENMTVYGSNTDDGNDNFNQDMLDFKIGTGGNTSTKFYTNYNNTIDGV